MDLYLWPGRWDLGSFDPECLCVLTYIKFGGLPINLRTQLNLKDAPDDGAIPYLQHGRNITYGLKHIFEYLRKENYGIEYDFDEADLVRLNALMKTVEVELMPAVHHLWLVNIENFTQCTRKAYCEAVGFPQCLYLGRQIRNRAMRRLYKGHPWPSPTVSHEVVDEAIYSQAKVCLTSLVYLLGDNHFFLGEKPSAIDAVIFGLLFPLIRAPLPHHPLTEHLRHCDSLIRFCHRIQTAYFQPSFVGVNINANANQSNTQHPGAADGSQGLESIFSLTGLRNLALFGLGAVTVNFAYAYASNMVEVNMEGADDDEGDVEQVAASEDS